MLSPSPTVANTCNMFDGSTCYSVLHCITQLQTPALCDTSDGSTVTEKAKQVHPPWVRMQCALCDAQDALCDARDACDQAD